MRGNQPLLIFMEEWRDVPGYEGMYQISITTKEGRCLSLNYRGSGKAKELNIKPTKTEGRIKWGLTKNGCTKTYQAARWIAFTYPELIQNEYFEGAHIDHIDTDKLNNHPSNLRWVTPKENANNPITREHYSNAKKGKPLSNEHKKRLSEVNFNCKWASKRIQQYTNSYKYIATYPSAKDAERKTGTPNGNIIKCCMRKRKTAGGFIWKYA